MAIGGEMNNSGRNTNGNGNVNNQYFSRLRIKDANEASKYQLAFGFNNGLLKFEISEEKDGFKYDSVINIHLSPTKAKMLAAEIDAFKKYRKSGNIDPNRAFGVNAGLNEKVSFIAFSAKSEKETEITIGKFDGSGMITDYASIMLHSDYHYALEWNDLSNMDLVKAYYDDIELDQIHELLIDFARYMNGAIGYATADVGRFDLARILKKMDPIYDKLGIERNNNSSGSRTYSRNSFLDGTKSVSSNHTSFEDMEGLLTGDDE